MAKATRVQAAILARDGEEEWAERIQGFLLVEKRTKPCCSTSVVPLAVLLLAFGNSSIYYHECMFNVSNL
jgi:hypothetical protein